MSTGEQPSEQPEWWTWRRQVVRIGLIERSPLRSRIERQEREPLTGTAMRTEHALPSLGIAKPRMKISVMTLAARIYLGGTIIPFEVCENIRAPIDPGGIAEPADRADSGAHELAGAEHSVLDRCDGAACGPKPPVVCGFPRTARRRHCVPPTAIPMAISALSSRMMPGRKLATSAS